MTMAGNFTNDPRYTLIKIPSVSEFETQELSGVLDTLEGLPLYNYYLPEAEEDKTANQQLFYSKSYTPWKLSCDTGNSTRENISLFVSDVLL